MPLINNDVLPVIFAQFKSVLQDEVISSNTHIPFGGLHYPQSLCTSIGIPFIHYFSDRRRPFLKLSHPIRNCRQRSHHQKRAIIFFVLYQIAQQSNSLNRLAQSHLIRKYTVQIVVVKRYQPLQPMKLISFELPALKNSWLLLDVLLDGVGQVVVDRV